MLREKRYLLIMSEYVMGGAGPSRVEGTPNVVMEAYAYGSPVIVSDIEAERDIVRNLNLRFQLCA